MKYLLSSICALTVSALTLHAASPSQVLLSSAAKQELEEKIRRLQAEVEDIKAVNTSLTQNLNALTKQVRDQNAAMKKMIDAYKIALADYVRQSELEALAKSVREIERNRKSDQAQITKKLQDLRKIILENSRQPIIVTQNPNNSSSGRSARPEEPRGVYHKVESGQTVMDILKAYNAELKRSGRKARVSLSQIKEANPKINVDLIRVGQEIFIPIID